LNKRYQVFVSSTYADLETERQAVIQALMEMDCIPAGMELFPAADEEQWNFIKRVIDDCDYYVLIIGGRYGSLSDVGLSYTEMEYNYAIERGIKVLAFLHKNPSVIPAGKTDVDPELREKLDSFREKVKTNRLVKFWESANELPGLVALSLTKTIKIYPELGWVRGDGETNAQLLSDLNDIRKKNEDLKSQLAVLEAEVAPSQLDLAPLHQLFELELIEKNYYQHSSGYKLDTIKVSVRWSKIFSMIGPYLYEHPGNGRVKSFLSSALYCLHKNKLEAPATVSLSDSDYETIRVQFESLGLVSINYSKTTKGGMGLFWSLTKRGKQEIAKLRAVKKKDTSTSSQAIPVEPEID